MTTRSDGLGTNLVLTNTDGPKTAIRAFIDDADTRLVIEVSDTSITDTLGSPDDMKFRSSMTLFHEVSGRKLFGEAIAKFYPEGFDQRTLSVLQTMR